MTNASDGQIYDFCLEWQMGFPTSKRNLCKFFVVKNWDYYHFEKVAKEHNWFVNSMYALLYAEDFGGQ